MYQLPPALAYLREWRQFVVSRDDGKPLSPYTGRAFAKESDYLHRPDLWSDFDTAAAKAATIPGATVGFVLTNSDPMWCLDIDNCATEDGWSKPALSMCDRFPGNAIEHSRSGTGLHIWGTGQVVAHGCKNSAYGFELYHTDRVIALGGVAVGLCTKEATMALAGVISEFFPPTPKVLGVDWTDVCEDGWPNIADDDELLRRARAYRSAGATFGSSASFAQLWDCDEVALAKHYPPLKDGQIYDPSSADLALALHLAFWTGKNCDRMLSLMWKSGLVREKWEAREDDYLRPTIINACGLVKPPKIKAASEAQRELAERIRDAALARAPAEVRAALSSPALDAKFWADNRDVPPETLAQRLTPAYELTHDTGVVVGVQYLGADLQQEHFKGCTYVASLDRVLTPEGLLLKSPQFNALFGGYVFQMDDSGRKTTRKAFEAFTESQLVRFPKAHAAAFRPLLAQGAIFMHEGLRYVNTWAPVPVASQAGDVGPFLAHVHKLLPHPHDAAILLAYMAACVQHVGVKFQWCPLIQGVEGNGKTLFTRVVAAALGERYSFLPRADMIDEKFNTWLFTMVFVGVEDIYVHESRTHLWEYLKPVITGERQSRRGMQQEWEMGDVCANFILNSNHLDAVRKTANDRRLCVFYTAQQTADDLQRDGMGGDYFSALYDWLKHRGGYAAVTNWLQNYDIPDELNPAGACQRAPVTSSTGAAIELSRGGIEQEVLEAIAEGRQGFAGGWVSSVALDNLLNAMRAGRAVPPNKRRAMLQDLGYDWHPALADGRAHSPIALDQNKKPRLYIKAGHICSGLSTGAAVIEAYEKAQTTIDRVTIRNHNTTTPS